jgi:LysM repeat protein
MFFHLRNKVLWLAPLLAAGCVTTQDYQARMDARAQENQRLLQEQSSRLAGRLETLELDNQKLRTDLDALRAAQARATSGSSEVQALRASLGNLESRLHALEASREKDKQELVDVLSRKISQIMGGAPVDSGSKKKTGGSKTTTTGGGDYVVKRGDTLSGIASAHGITMSALMEANGIKKANALQAGQKLVIPK